MSTPPSPSVQEWLQVPKHEVREVRLGPVGVPARTGLSTLEEMIPELLVGPLPA